MDVPDWRVLCQENTELKREIQVFDKTLELMAIVADCNKCDAKCPGKREGVALVDCIGHFKAKARRRNERRA